MGFAFSMSGGQYDGLRITDAPEVSPDAAHQNLRGLHQGIQGEEYWIPVSALEAAIAAINKVRGESGTAPLGTVNEFGQRVYSLADTAEVVGRLGAPVASIIQDGLIEN